ncbi:MAG: hypothetical protein HY019_08645 [Aquabacterium sp.]|uniref:hypothetical protein n=1 Tax=Aquabacterium sp. TaxID=1872578 RepID=UPI0025BA06C3|nr:hypothetical protein [Aquabacterium sp.]MBI3382059.1 hypothetical protein [Aquabacterium sp.]
MKEHIQTEPVSPVFTAADAPLHLANGWLQSLRSLESWGAFLVKETGDMLETKPAAPGPTGMAGVMMADAMMFWADQFLAQQQLAGAMLESCMRWGKDVEAGLAEVMKPPSGQALHITPDSAGVALSSLDPTPKGIVDAFAGTANAMMQAWANALEHEVEDAQTTQPAPEQRH